MIDEHYSRWEWSEVPLNTRLYGVKTVYAYDNMMQALSHYFPVRRNFEEITERALEGVSVLILKTPTAPYSPAAVTAIHRFLESGGGVWLVGDHTNIFGMDGYLNQIASRYGCAFEYNAIIDPESNRQLYAPSPLAHPILRRSPLYLWYTSDSLRPNWFSHDALLSPRLLDDNPNYGVNTFFGNFSPDLDERVGPAVQTIAIPAGRGRLSLWSDSTPFSNFAIFLPGKMEVALATMDWLNRRNSPFPLRAVWICLGALLLSIGLVRPDCGRVCLGLWVGIGIAAPLIGLCYDRSYPDLRPKIPFDQVAFLEPNVEGHLPTSAPVDGDEPNAHSYLSAFLAAQRAGKRTFVADTVGRALSAHTIVIVHSHFKFSAEEQAQLRTWVEQGGQLILMDGGFGDRAALESFTTPIGVTVHPLLAPPHRQSDGSDGSDRSVLAKVPLLFATGAPLSGDQPQIVIQDTTGARVGIQAGSAGLAGGRPLLRSAQGGEPVAVSAPLGKGRVIVTGTSSLFSDISLGENSGIPDSRQLTLLRMLFDWYGADAHPR